MSTADSQGVLASQPKYKRLCKHASEMEQLAANAERASIKYKQTEFLSDKIGQEYDATVSGVSDFCIYAEIDENKCEGLIAVHYLGDEPFDFDEPNFRLVRRHSHTVVTIGDKIRIKVAQANLERKQLDFQLVARLDEQPHSDRNTTSPLRRKDGDGKTHSATGEAITQALQKRDTLYSFLKTFF